MATAAVELAKVARKSRWSQHQDQYEDEVITASQLQRHTARHRNQSVRSKNSVPADEVTHLWDLYYSRKSAFVRLRWSWLWQILLLAGFYPFLALIPGLSRGVYAATLLLNLTQAIFLGIGAVSCWIYIFKLGSAVRTKWSEKAVERFGATRAASVRHLFVLPAYKEPLDLLEATISTIAAQTVAQSVAVCVTLEERTPDVKQKKKALQAKFSGSFGRFIATTHPRGLDGEIPGACSNRNWGVRRALHLLQDDPAWRGDDVLVTVCDSDTLFLPSYAECLTHAFLAAPYPMDVCYQSPLFYNIALDQARFFTRVTALIRSFLMVGFLIPMNINTMSIYSIPLKLLRRSRFFHPGYQMDDIIFTLSAMNAIGKRVCIERIDVPTLSGPTSGATFGDELHEWYVQAKRWTIGAGEVFHYFFVKFIGRKFTFASGAGYGTWLTYYYAWVLCTSGMVGLSHIAVQVITGLWVPECALEPSLKGSFLDFGIPVQWLDAILQGWIYLIFFLTAFILDRRIVSVCGLKDSVSPPRQLLHYLSSQLVLWGYCLVEYAALAQLSVYGKKVCGHVPSAKDQLAKPAGSAPEALMAARDPDAELAAPRKACLSVREALADVEEIGLEMLNDLTSMPPEEDELVIWEDQNFVAAQPSML